MSFFLGKSHRHLDNSSKAPFPWPSLLVYPNDELYDAQGEVRVSRPRLVRSLSFSQFFFTLPIRRHGKAPFSCVVLLWLSRFWSGGLTEE